MSVNNLRKCAKCGKTRAEDMKVSYHRFPLPGTTNITKARAWAKYCWPNQDWTSEESLLSVYKSNKMLCGRHFSSTQFYDEHRQKLSKFAVPDSSDVVALLQEQENVFHQDEEQLSNVPRVPLSEIENFQVDPAPSTLIRQLSAFPKQNEEHHSNLSRVPLLELEKENMQVEPTPSTSTQQSSFGFPAHSKPAFNKQIAALEIPHSTATKAIHDTDTHVKPATAKKKRKGVLRALNISKISEMTAREVKMYKICKKNLKELTRLRADLKKKKVKNVIKKLSESENVQELLNLNMSGSFAVLLQNQLTNCPRKPKGRRYTIKQKIMALVMYKKSPACYRLLRRMFALPSQSSLNKVLNKIPLRTGINEHIFTSLREMTKTQTDEENMCILSFDEMSIRKNLFYNMKLDEIQGYQDHGNHGRSGEVATKALVFMLSGLRMKWKQPVAFYLSHTLSADRLTVILKEVLRKCFEANLNVVSTVCDLSTVNVKVLKTLGATSTEPYFILDGQEVIAILDPPHLLKCTRNLFLKHNIECTTDLQCNENCVKGIAKWSHIEAFYNSDKNNTIHVFATKLTDSHLKPNTKQQMKVKLAAQIFSNTVSGGILAKISTGELPAEAHATASLLRKFDRLFDALNADTPDLRGGKKFSTNMTKKSPHLSLFRQMKEFIKDMRYLGSRSNPPSQEGWIHTINAVERLWTNLSTRNIKSLSTRRLNQDPLENFFGCIRYNCGSNDNPTVIQFVAGVKTAIISNLRHSGQNKNCEDDSAVLTNNLTSFLIANIATENISNESEQSEPIEGLDVENVYSDVVEAVEKASSESQACGYVCGFIFKKLQHKDCASCKKIFLADFPEAIHIFTSFKEYDDTRSSLNYVSNSFISVEQTMATVIHNYLQTNSWKPQIRNNLMTAIEKVNLEFLNNCVTHLATNKKILKDSIFYISIKRFITMKNRAMEEEEKQRALEKKIRILRNK